MHDAIVEAALKIARKFGAEHTLALLKHEAVPQAVASRILADGPRQIRVRRPAD